MSDYTQSIDFSAKDALTTGDPNKVTKGVDVDTELGLISTAIATKVNKVASATNNNLVAMDSNGDAKDSGLVTANTPQVNLSVEFQKEVTFDAQIDNGNSGTADTIDWTEGNKQLSTLTGNVTYTFTNPSGVCNVILKLIQDGTGSRTVTWPAAVQWAEGSAPILTTTANAVDIVAFYFDGVNYFGSTLFDFS